VIFGALLFFIKPWALYFHVPAFFYGANDDWQNETKSFQNLM